MLLYFDPAYDAAKREHLGLTREQLYEAIVEGTARSLRPKFMTFATMSIGLIPILWSAVAGFEIMQRMAALKLSPAGGHPPIGRSGTVFANRPSSFGQEL